MRVCLGLLTVGDDEHAVELEECVHKSNNSLYIVLYTIYYYYYIRLHDFLYQVACATKLKYSCQRPDPELRKFPFKICLCSELSKLLDDSLEIVETETFSRHNVFVSLRPRHFENANCQKQ